MQEPILYLDDLVKADPKRPGARAPAGAKQTFDRKMGKVGKKKTTAAPSAPMTTPKTKFSDVGARAPKGEEQWEWWSGDGVPDAKLGYEQGPEGGWRRKPGSGPGVPEAGPETSDKDLVDEDGKLHATPPDEALSATQQPDKKVVSTGTKAGPVSSSEAKLSQAAKPTTTAASIETKKRNAPAAKTSAAGGFSYSVLPKEEGDEGVWVVDKDSGYEYDISDDSDIPSGYTTLEDVTRDVNHEFEDGENQEQRIAIAKMKWKMGQKPADPKSEKVKEKKAEIKEEMKTGSKAAAEKQKEKVQSKKDDLAVKKTEAQIKQIEAKTKQIQSGGSSSESKSPSARAPAGAKKTFDRKMGKVGKKKPSSATSSPKTTPKTKFSDVGARAPKKDTAPKKETATKTESKRPSARAPKTDAQKKIAADNQKVLDSKKKEQEKAKIQASAKKKVAEASSGSSSGSTSKPKGSKSKTSNTKQFVQGFRQGRVPGTRMGEAAAIAEAGGHLLSAGVEYGVGGALAAGQHLLQGKGKDPTPNRTPKTKAKTPTKGSEVAQSSMKSLPIYLDLHKAIQMPNAGTTTPSDKRARDQHLSSYAKRPVGVANEGIVTEDDPEEGKQWKHDEEDSVQAEVDAKLAPKEEEEKEVNKAIELLKTMNTALQEEVRSSLPNSLEVEFMVDELGYDPLKVSKGLMSIKGRDRHTFNEWAHSRLSKSITSLYTVSGLTDDY